MMRVTIYFKIFYNFFEMCIIIINIVLYTKYTKIKKYKSKDKYISLSNLI